jgi:hypothetical protein
MMSLPYTEEVSEVFHRTNINTVLNQIASKGRRKQDLYIKVSGTRVRQDRTTDKFYIIMHDIEDHQTSSSED